VRVRHPNVAEGEPLALIHSILHVLAPGYGMDLREMEPRLPEAEGAMADRPD